MIFCIKEYMSFRIAEIFYKIVSRSHEKQEDFLTEDESGDGSDGEIDSQGLSDGEECILEGGKLRKTIPPSTFIVSKFSKREANYSGAIIWAF